jgi:Flp pilus assembly protein TadG
MQGTGPNDCIAAVGTVLRPQLAAIFRRFLAITTGSCVPQSGRLPWDLAVKDWACGMRVKFFVSAMSPPRNLWRRLANDRAGLTTVEFAIAAAMFTAVIVGVAQGGILLYDEVELANAVGIGSRTFAVARHASCSECTARPYTDTINAIANSGRLRLAAANVTVAVGGTPCTSDGTCLKSLNAAHSSGPYYSPSSQTSVTLTYPCPKLLPSALFDTIGVCPSGNFSFEISQQVQ